MDDKAKMLEITRETSNHAYLATCDATQPIIRSVSPIVEENMSIWVTTFSNSRKVKQIKSNPKICLYFASQETVQFRQNRQLPYLTCSFLFIVGNLKGYTDYEYSLKPSIGYLNQLLCLVGDTALTISGPSI